MPIYTYRCENCGVQFDRQQKFSDPPLTRCPECSKKTLRKVYLPVGIVFKGSGFYATDHRSPSGGGRTSHASKPAESDSHTDSTEKPSTPPSPSSSDK
ncbi:MAG: FmdB family zinc ribbon protein [Omnitrophica WOR_2 bacterium]